MTRRPAHFIAAGLPVRGQQPATLALALAVAFGSLALPAGANPTGGVAVHGQASMATSGNRLTVTTQNGAGSGHSAINWQSFSIPAGNVTVFQQPSATSTVINRVVTNNPSQIFGTLSSNGRLVLVNQSGIAVGAGAVIDTAGFTASALRMSDADALAGRMRFGDPTANMGGAGGITVGGRVIAREGDVVLIAPNIDIGAGALVQAPNGNTILAAGQQVEITGRGLEGIRLVVQAPENQARNLGRLEGDAVAMFAGTLRHSGEIQATTATMEGGKILLKSSGDTYIEGSGKLIATGTRGGQVDVLGNRVAVADQAVVDASGAQGGGRIRVGGDFQGKNPDVANAQRTYLGPQATLRADAQVQGDGGTVIVWADEQTKAYGTVTARGGAAGGDGGFVEISGKQRMVFEAAVDIRASQGRQGTLLLDPEYINVAIGGGATIGQVDQFSDSPLASLVISPATLNLVGGNVMLQALEDIGFDDPVNLTTSGATLTALAGGIITVSASITTNGGAVTLYADAPGAGGPGSNGSAVYVSAPIDTSNAAIVLRSDASDVGGNSIQISANVNAGTAGLTIQAPNDRIQQLGGTLTAGSLTAESDYRIDLNQVGNQISGAVNLLTNTATLSAGVINFRNDGPSTNLVQAVAKGNIAITANGTMSTGFVQSTTGNVTLSGFGGLTLTDDVMVAGTLALNATGNPIVQASGVIEATGATTVNAGTGAIILGSTGNDFSTTVNVTGGAIQVRDANALTIGTLSYGATGALQFDADGGTLSLPAGAINAGSNSIQLTSALGFSTPGALTGGNITLSSAGNLTLAHNITASGTLTLNGGGGTGVTQTAGNISATGLTTLQSNAGASTLNSAGNDFSSISVFGAGATVRDANALTLDQWVVNGNSSVQFASGTLLQTNPISAQGTFTVLGGINPVSLTHAGNDFATVAITGGTVNVNDSNSIVLGAQNVQNLNVTSGGNITQSAAAIVSGTTNVNATGAITLTTLGNNLNQIHISAGQAINVVEGAGSNLTVLSLSNVLNQPVSLAAGHTLTLPATPINTGSGDLSLVSPIGTLNIPATLTGNDLLLQSGAGINVNAGISASGNLDLDAASAIGVFAPISVGTLFTATNTNSGTPMLVRDQVTAGSMSINLNAGLQVQGQSPVTGAGLTTTGGPGQTINALYLEVVASAATGSAQIIANNGGPQTITTSGNSGTGNSILLQNIDLTAADALIETRSGGAQSITATNGNSFRVQGQGGNAEISSSGNQTITLQGSGSNALVIGDPANTGGSVILSDASQTIVAGLGGQSGGITIRGGLTAGTHNGISTDAGPQSVTSSGDISVQGGTAAGPAGVALCDEGLLGSCGAIAYAGGVSQLVRAANIFLTGGASGSSNYGIIQYQGTTGTQTIQIDGGGGLELQGGAAGDANRADIQFNGASQVLAFPSGGSIHIEGGGAGTNNRARIIATGAASTQTITGSPSLTLQGGAGGGGFNLGNRANLFANGSQNLTIGGSGITLTGGGGSGLETDNDALIDQLGGVGTTQVINVTNGNITMTGGSSARLDVGGSGHGSRALIEALGDSQTITMSGGGNITLSGGSVGSRAFAQIFAGNNATQSITGAGTINLSGGDGGGGIYGGGTVFEGNRGVIATNAGAQTIQAASIHMNGGDGGEGNRAEIFSGGDQTITLSNGLQMQGGGGGGGAGNLGNSALIQTTVGNQTITVGGGGISMTGGSGGGGEINNTALIRLGDNTVSRPGKVQTITVNGGGDISLTGGTTSELTMVVADCGSCAVLRSDGDAQNISFSAGGMLDVAGGSGGIRNHASVFANFDATQSIIGVTGITVDGGTSGGSVGNGNFAFIGTNSGSQTLSVGANGITLQAGISGTENTATIRQSTSTGSTLGTQLITIGGGGAVSLDGGNGDTNLARIQSFGATQTLNYLAGGALNLTGGTGSQLNYARVEAVNGNQVITGLPSILVRGGASGGADLNGNFAQIVATLGAQNIDANQIGIEAGAFGIGNFAVIQAPTQNITTAGNLHMTGGGSAASIDGTQGAGARIGGIGTGATNLILDVGNDLTMTGGSAVSAGASIGANIVGGNPTALTITVLGNLSMLPGSTASAGSRIGSPAANVAGGNISISVPNGQFSMAGASSGETSIRTLGNVAIATHSANIGNLISGNTVVVDSNQGLTLSGAASIAAAATSGNSLKLDAGAQGFVNTAGAGVLSVAGSARWLVFSNDPLLDNAGGLAHDFRQYGKSFVDAVPIASPTGNGLIHSFTPTINANLVGTVSKTYDGTTAATLAAGNYSATLETSGPLSDVVTLNNPVAGTYDTKDVGTGKGVLVGGLGVVSVVDSAGRPVFGHPTTLSPIGGLVGEITGASITSITGLLANPKTYDGTTVATIGGVPTFVGMAAGDSLTFNFGTASFLDKHVGNGKSVTINGVTIGGPDAGNYLSTPTTASAFGNITPAPITSVTGITANNKTYDGTAAATLNLGGAAFTGMIPGDTLTVNSANGAFVDKNASFAPKTVNVSAITLGGGDALNYTLVSNTATTTANISQAQITAVNGITASKPYDGSNSATPITGAATFVGMVPGDNLAVAAGATATYNDRHVGTGKPLTVLGITLTGTDAGNYTLASGTAIGSGTITQLGSVTWTGGGGNQLWSNPANWAGGALPDGYNVAAVVIPPSAGTIDIDGAVGTFGINSLTSGSPVQQTGGALVTSSLTLNTQGGVNLASTSNQIGALSGSNSVGGDIQVFSLGNMQLGPLTNTAPSGVPSGSVIVSVDGNMLVGGDVSATNFVYLSATGSFYQNAAIVGPNGVDVSASTILPFGPLATTNGSPISYLANGNPVSPPPTELVAAVPTPPVDQIVVFLDLFERALNQNQSDDDDKDKKDADAIVTEGEVCR